MTSGPITSWQINGETMETVSDFIFWGSKITADGDCSHEIKRCLLLGRKVMTNLDSILKSRDITLPTKVHLVKAIVFAVVMYGYESWPIKNAEHQRIDAFELWYWRRLFRVPCTARRFNQSILNEISPEYSLEGLMLKLKLQYFGHLMWRADSLEKTLMLRKIEGRGRRERRGWDGWMASLTQWTWVWVNSGSWWWTGRPGMLQAMGSQKVLHVWATELNWTEWDILVFFPHLEPVRRENRIERWQVKIPSFCDRVSAWVAEPGQAASCSIYHIEDSRPKGHVPCRQADRCQQEEGEKSSPLICGEGGKDR